DGNKSTFGDTSVLTTVPNPDDVSAFGAVRSSDGAMTLMVVNKDITNASPFNATITNFNSTGIAQRWQLTSTSVITALTNLPVTNGIVSDTVPSQSITLYVLPGLLPFSLQKQAGSSPPGQVNLQLNGQSGLTYIVQSSTDLVHWTPYSTNKLVSNSVPFTVSTTGGGAKFYRGMFAP
ncbi:MAG TPA: cellulase, partial [Verrucomicrobiae bacterium]|nr:cellulase [Verrucomicrobiae bacterium]